SASSMLFSHYSGGFNTDLDFVFYNDTLDPLEEVHKYSTYASLNLW
ncbi:unnamed protein product, partial [marine sediment metagenome]